MAASWFLSRTWALHRGRPFVTSVGLKFGCGSAVYWPCFAPSPSKLETGYVRTKSVRDKTHLLSVTNPCLPSWLAAVCLGNWLLGAIVFTACHAVCDGWQVGFVTNDQVRNRDRHKRLCQRLHSSQTIKSESASVTNRLCQRSDPSQTGHCQRPSVTNGHPGCLARHKQLEPSRAVQNAGFFS